MLSDLLKNKAQFLELKRDIALNKTGHAYIIISKDEDMGLEFFKLVAKEILYRHQDTDKDIIDYKVENSLHPDVCIYDSRDKINVKLVEEFVLDVYNKGMEASYKLYLFNSFDGPLDGRVQNKMLKVYEEPPESVSIFILTNSESTLLATIKSRASKIYLPELEISEIKEILMSMDVNESEASAAAALGNGSLTLAKKLAQEPLYFKILDECIKVLAYCDHSSKISNYLDSFIFSKENISYTLDFFEVILREMATIISGGQKKIHNKDDLMEEIKGFSLSSISKAIFIILEARIQLSLNINNISVAETLLLNILEAKYKWQ